MQLSSGVASEVAAGAATSHSESVNVASYALVHDGICVRVCVYRIASCAAPSCRVASFRRVRARAESGGCLSVPQTGAYPTVRPSRFWAPGARRVHDRGRSGVPLHTVRTKVASLLVEGVARWCVVLIKCASHGRTPHDPTKDVRSACARAPRPAAWVAVEAAVAAAACRFRQSGAVAQTGR